MENALKVYPVCLTVENRQEDTKKLVYCIFLAESDKEFTDLRTAYDQQLSSGEEVTQWLMRNGSERPVEKGLTLVVHSRLVWHPSWSEQDDSTP